MKKRILWILLGSTALAGQTFAVTSSEALQWALDTKIVYPSSISWQSPLTRAEFAPILTAFIEKGAKKEYSDHGCAAKDVSLAPSYYQADLKKLCSYGILNGEKWSLYPLWKLTNGQAVTLVVRIMDGMQTESSVGQHWSQAYFNRATQLWYEVSHLSTAKNAYITYENLINLLYSALHPNTSISKTGYTTTNTTTTNTTDPLKRLTEIMAS